MYINVFKNKKQNVYGAELTQGSHVETCFHQHSLSGSNSSPIHISARLEEKNNSNTVVSTSVTPLGLILGIKTHFFAQRQPFALTRGFVVLCSSPASTPLVFCIMLGEITQSPVCSPSSRIALPLPGASTELSSVTSIRIRYFFSIPNFLRNNFCRHKRNSACKAF